MDERSGTGATSAVPDEEEFLEGANQAIHEAIEDLHRSGIPTTHVIDGELVRIHPDGKQETLRRVVPR